MVKINLFRKKKSNDEDKEVESIEFKDLNLFTQITPENMYEFTECLQNVVNHVHNVIDARQFVQEIPSEVNRRLLEQAKELENMYRDVRSAVVNISALKKQLASVSHEKKNINKLIKKLTVTELSEMENVVKKYCKPLYAKWESIKTTQRTSVLENFLNEVKGKHEATGVLQDLIERNMQQLENTSHIPIFKTDHVLPTLFNFGTADTSCSGTGPTRDSDNIRINRPSTKRKKIKQAVVKDGRKKTETRNTQELQLFPISQLTESESSQQQEVRHRLESLFSDMYRLPQLTYHNN